MSSGNPNPKPTPLFGATVNPRSVLINNFLGQLATALGVEILDERRAFYLHVLVDLTEDRINFAFEAALTRCKWFPTAAELFEFAYEFNPAQELPDYLRNNIGKNPIGELTKKMKSSGAVTEEDMKFYSERGRIKHEQILMDIARSSERRDMAGNPAIERKINEIRLSIGHPLALEPTQFEHAIRGRDQARERERKP